MLLLLVGCSWLGSLSCLRLSGRCRGEIVNWRGGIVLPRGSRRWLWLLERRGLAGEALVDGVLCSGRVRT